MTDESKTKTVRNAMVGVVVVVMLGLVGCPERKDSADMGDELNPSDVIKIRVPKEPLNISDEFRTILEGEKIKTILLISANEALPFFADGAPRDDLCAPSKSSDYGSRTCEQQIPSRDLMTISGSARGSNPCGFCTVGGKSRSCNKSSDKRDCNTEVYSCGGQDCVSN